MPLKQLIILGHGHAATVLWYMLGPAAGIAVFSL